MILVASMATGAFAAPPPCVSKLFETSRFTVCMLDTRYDDVRLVWKDDRGEALRGFSGLQSTLQHPARLRFAMNAGMFDAQGTPIGLFVENGIVRVPANTGSGSGNFYLKPNGVFRADKGGVVSVETMDGYNKNAKPPQWATQSGPMLLINGALNPQLAVDGPSKNIRNAVGVSGPRRAFFVISDDAVSFGRIARLFRDELACPNALYLDGTVSSLWSPALGRRDARYPLGPLVVVFKR